MITGKPVEVGGSLGRTEATGFGVIFTVREALKELGIRPQDTTASVQGFGNVAQYASKLWNELGGVVVRHLGSDEGSVTAMGIEFGSTRIKAVLIGDDHTPIASGSYDWENQYEDGIWTYSLDDVFGKASWLARCSD